jgi:hypothetical protein
MLFWFGIEGEGALLPIVLIVLVLLLEMLGGRALLLRSRLKLVGESRGSDELRDFLVHAKILAW